MTVSNQTVSVVHRGNGASRIFPYNFRLPEMGMVRVSIREYVSKKEVTVVAPGNYTITGVDKTNYNGGNVTYPVAGGALTLDYEIVIERRVEYTQDLVLLNEGGFYPEAVEYQLDKLEFQIQQIADLTGRGIVVPIGVEAPTWLAGKPSNLIYVNDDNEVVSSDTPANEAALRSTKDNDLQRQIDELTGHTFGLDYARYGKEEEIKDLGVNDTLASGGGWPQTPKQEVNAIYTGNNATHELPKVAASDMATVLFLPPTEDSTNFVAPTVPYIPFKDGRNIRAIPLDIRTVLGNSPVNLSLFEPVETNGFGTLVFRYTGNEPIFAVMEGSITVCIRGATADGDIPPNTLLSLQARNVPLLEQGQNDGQRYLGAAFSSFSTYDLVNDCREFNDLCAPIDAAALNAVIGDDLFVGYDNGFFSGTDSEEELQTEIDGVPVGPEVRTTKWMSLAGIDPRLSCLLMDFTGVSTRGRVQYKRADGTIMAMPSQNRDASARRIYRVPFDAVEFRVYYSGVGDSAGTPVVKRISDAVSTVYDPTKGFWIRRTFSIMRDVVFWPGGEYALNFVNTVFTPTSQLREWAFRFESGGLKMMVDVGHLRKNLASKLYGEF